MLKASRGMALICGRLGVIYGSTGRPREVEPFFQSAIDTNRRLLGLEHPRLLDSMCAYANLLRTAKRKGEAKKLEADGRESTELSAEESIGRSRRGRPHVDETESLDA